MKLINKLSRIIVIGLLFFIYSCSSSDDTIIIEIDDEDQIEETELSFKKVTQPVTFDICTTSYCGITQLTFFDENIGYAVTGVDLYKTETGGEEWVYVLNQDIVGRLITISQDVMFLNVYDGILKTINAATSWSTIDRPLDFICEPTGFINPGIIHFVDESIGFIQDKCYKGDLYRTIDSGDTWEQIYSGESDIFEFHFIDSNTGFIKVDDTLYLTENNGVDWQEIDRLPNSFDYVIEKENIFLFPEGTPDVAKPDVVNENLIVTKYDVNDNGDIAVVLYDQSVQENNWQLMMYLNNDAPEWILVDQLIDLPDPLSIYSSIQLTNNKSMYLGISRSGEILKYYIE